MGCNTEYFTKDVSLNASKNALQSYYIFICPRSSVPTLLTDQKKAIQKGVKKVSIKVYKKCPKKCSENAPKNVNAGELRWTKVVESG